MVLNFRRHIEYQKETIASKVLMKSSGGTVTLFAFAAEQALSEHTAPLNALLPHAVTAGTDFKMLLTMSKG